MENEWERDTENVRIERKGRSVRIFIKVKDYDIDSNIIIKAQADFKQRNIARVLKYLNGKSWVCKEKLGDATHVTGSEAKEVIDYLQEKGVLEVKKEPGKTRPITYFKLREQEDKSCPQNA